ncbi:MAG: hypothetical protein H0U49_11880, partial [Parachlamydiaceae bacterium]|nr:hypothetical protein [Parachlamydiaceae bacterium]
MTINPLANLAQVIAQTPPDDKKTPEVFQKRHNPVVYNATKKDAIKWKSLTTWETLLKIETLMLDEDNLKEINNAQLDSLKKYCITAIINESGIFNTLWTLFKHIIKDGFWISTSGKATEILINVINVKNKKKNKIPLVNFQPDFEILNTGSQGPSRIYSVKEEKHFNLSSAKKGIGFINGIQNSYVDATNNAKYLATLAGESMEVDCKALHTEEGVVSGFLKKLPRFLYSPEEKVPVVLKGVHIDAVYNAVHGIFADLKESWFGWYGHSTKPACKVRKMWTNFFKKNPDGKFLMFCHSQGAIHVKHALVDYPESLRKRIEIVAIAPGVFIDPKHCARVI